MIKQKAIGFLFSLFLQIPLYSQYFYSPPVSVSDYKYMLSRNCDIQRIANDYFSKQFDRYMPYYFRSDLLLDFSPYKIETSAGTINGTFSQYDFGLGLSLPPVFGEASKYLPSLFYLVNETYLFVNPGERYSHPSITEMQIENSGWDIGAMIGGFSQRFSRDLNVFGGWSFQFEPYTEIINDQEVFTWKDDENGPDQTYQLVNNGLFIGAIYKQNGISSIVDKNGINSLHVYGSFDISRLVIIKPLLRIYNYFKTYVPQMDLSGRLGSFLDYSLSGMTTYNSMEKKVENSYLKSMFSIPINVIKSTPDKVSLIYNIRYSIYYNFTNNPDERWGYSFVFNSDLRRWKILGMYYDSEYQMSFQRYDPEMYDRVPYRSRSLVIGILLSLSASK